MTERISRMLADGPPGTGLMPMELEAEDFHSPLPRQHIHFAFTDAALGLKVGTWDTTSMQEAFGPYPGEEFIVVLVGNFAIIDGKGEGTPVEAGQSVILRDGAQVSWVEAGDLRKFFVVVDDLGMPMPQDDTSGEG